MTALVLLPGLDGTGRLLEEFAAVVAPHFDSTRIVAYPKDEVLDYDALARRVHAQLPTESRFVLLAESFSGPVALRVAAMQPHGLAALVLSATFARGPFHLLDALTPAMRHAPTRLPRAVLRVVLLGRWYTPTLLALLESAVNDVAPDVLRQRAISSVCVDDRGVLPRIHVPVLALHAIHDRLLPRRVREEFAEGLPEVTQVDVEGPHVLLQAQPALCAAHIGRFVRARL